MNPTDQTQVNVTLLSPAYGTPRDRSTTEQVDSTPSHYQSIDKEGQRYLISTNAPNVKLYIERGLTVTSSTRKKYPQQAIFLDGVFNEAPFLDNEARQYSLDHHAGCVRAFTLATCEQAAVMLLQGLPLEEGDWHLYINDPDLDSLLAAWVLLNHAELRRDEWKLLKAAMPLIRLEGVIDAHGLERALLSGLPAEVHQLWKSHIDVLITEERRLKGAGKWDTMDPLGYATHVFNAIDRLIFPPEYLSQLLAAEMVEVGRLPIQMRRVALLCSSRQSIYIIESKLKERYDNRIGVIILDQGDGKFTVRQVDSFLTRNLEHLYRLLNREDPNATRSNRWGGSADIGGSPRETGSGLSADTILRLVAEEYAEGGAFRRVWRRISSLRWWRRWREGIRKLRGQPPALPSQ